MAESVAKIADVPIIFVHGVGDARIPAECSKKTYSTLDELAKGVPRAIHILPHREHDVTLDDDEGVSLPFLESNVRDPYSRHLFLRVTNEQQARRYWLGIVRKNQRVAELDARIEADSTVELIARNAAEVRLYLRPELFPSYGPIRIVINKKEAFRGSLSGDCETLRKSVLAEGDRFLGYTDLLKFDVDVPSERE